MGDDSDRKNQFLEICCLKDEHGYKDSVIGWTRCKIGAGICIWSMIFALAIARPFVADGGFLGFACCVLVIYYFVTLTVMDVKPQGIYHLCKVNLVALKVCHQCLGAMFGTTESV